MSVRLAITYFGFALWVAICAAAPEFIWQGLMALVGHFSLQDAYSIGLIGLILTVFVEPILERAREGRWRPEHRSERSLLLTAPIAFIFGVVAVALHECMTAYLTVAASSADPGGLKQAGLTSAVNLILEWAWIPLAVTLAWFSARYKGPTPLVVGACAALWVIGVGWYYAWPLRDIVMTAIPCIALIPIGQIYVAQNWGEHMFENLALGLMGLITVWLLVTLALPFALRHAGITDFNLYDPGDLGGDFRFYLGWALGLALAPNPVPRNRVPPKPDR